MRRQRLNNLIQQHPVPPRPLTILLLALVFASLLTANYVAELRLAPEVSAVDWIAEKPNYDDHLLNVHQLAAVRAKGSPDSLLPIYDERNPGFFLLVAELFARAGAKTPLPLEIVSISLFDIGAIAFFFWVFFLFDDLVVAAFATAFLATSQFFLFFPGVTHTFPYEFSFFNITILLFVLFLRTGRKVLLLASLATMFLTCMNYWFYYMSSWIIMVGLWWQYRGRPRIKDIAIVSSPPIAAAGLTAIMVMSLSGGLKQGAFRLADIFVARTLDARIPGGTWFPDQKFMRPLDWLAYPTTVADRLEWAYSFDFFWFFVAATLTLFLLSLHNTKALISALVLIAAGFSWYCVMFQHTHIHAFVGQYSFMAICPVFGLIVSEALYFNWRFMSRIKPATWFGAVTSDLPAIALLLVAGCAGMWPSLERTYYLVTHTTEISSTVRAEYASTIYAICQQHSEITLADLQHASEHWDFKWNPQLITDTDRTPKCP